MHSNGRRDRHHGIVRNVYKSKVVISNYARSQEVFQEAYFVIRMLALHTKAGHVETYMPRSTLGTILEANVSCFTHLYSERVPVQSNFAFQVYGTSQWDVFKYPLWTLSLVRR